MFTPNYRISPAVATSLMGIEASRQAVIDLPINVEVLASLRQTAKLVATHYSTQIEGNRLTQAQVDEVVAGAHFPGRERDEAEVRNYYRALERVETLVAEGEPITEVGIRRIHGVVETGRASATPYRDGQNVIRDANGGGIVYMPPEAKDVPRLMGDLFDWIGSELDTLEIPVPIIAAIAHYQYATIHPYYDGNGRTARLLTTYILHHAGYGLKGIYSLEEHYANDLGAYYEALTVGPSHNYYLGRVEAEVTGFVEYFCSSMEYAFSAVRSQAVQAARQELPDTSARLRMLDSRQRRVLELYRDRMTATTAEIADRLGLAPRTAAEQCRKWMNAGFLVVEDPSRRHRTYRLADEYESLVTRSRWRPTERRSR